MSDLCDVSIEKTTAARDEYDAETKLDDLLQEFSDTIRIVWWKIYTVMVFRKVLSI